MTIAQRMTDCRISLFFQFEAYKEEQLPIMKKEHPGLRLQQYSMSRRCSKWHLIADVVGPRRRSVVRELQEGTAFLPALLLYAEADDLCSYSVAAKSIQPGPHGPCVFSGLVYRLSASSTDLVLEICRQRHQGRQGVGTAGAEG